MCIEIIIIILIKCYFLQICVFAIYVFFHIMKKEVKTVNLSFSYIWIKSTAFMKYDVFWSIYNSVFGIYSGKYLLYVLFAGIQNLYIYQMCDLSGLETGGWVAIRADINWRRRFLAGGGVQRTAIANGWRRRYLQVEGMVIILLGSAVWYGVELFYKSDWSWEKLKIPIGNK